MCPWWRHQGETVFTFLAICAGNSPVTCEFPSQRPVTRSFDVFFDLRLSKWLVKQSRRRWFEIDGCNTNVNGVLAYSTEPSIWWFITHTLIYGLFLFIACFLLREMAWPGLTSQHIRYQIISALFLETWTDLKRGRCMNIRENCTIASFYIKRNITAQTLVTYHIISTTSF